jgi:hypothetical protein
MKSLIALLIIPLILLNCLGAVVSGLWLALLGVRWPIGYGVAALFSTFLLGIIMMPGLIFGLPAAYLLEKGRTFLAFPFVFLSQLYTYGVITAWCILVFYIFISRANHETFWPLLIWSYGVALGPWVYMAEQEQQGGNEFSTMTTFFAEIAYVIMTVVLIIFGDVTLVELGIVFVSVMIVGMLIQTRIAFATPGAV